MPTIVHGFDWPDRFVVGTVGSPGSRAFYLQARDGSRVVSVAVEKEQSSALADKVDEMLDELATVDDNPFNVPDGVPDELADLDPLDQPVESEFRVGMIALGFDPRTAQIVIGAYPVSEDDEAEAEPGSDGFDPAEEFQVKIPVGQARAFSRRARDVVGAGRPRCPLCGEPMDLSGHDCPLSGGL